MAVVLAVDDDEDVCRLVIRAVESIGHQGISAASVAQAREVLAARDVDLVVCDVNLPDSSGLLLAREIADQLPDTALFMLSGVDDPAVAAEALALGACAYVLKPFVLTEIVINVTNGLRLRDLQRRQRRHEADRENNAIARPASLGAVLSDIGRQTPPPTDDGDIDVAADIAQRLASAVALRDDESGSHILRTSQYAVELGRTLQLDDRALHDLGLSVMLHDVGKIGVSDEILLKPAALDEHEAEQMRRHPELGHRLLAASDSPVLQLAAEVALSHHERWDGTGYPRGLAGEAIPFQARIAAVADVFDALTTDRADRRAHSVDAAADLIRGAAGTQFDPVAVEAFERSIVAIGLVCGNPFDRPAPPSTSVLVVDGHRMFAESVARLIDREVGLHVVGLAATADEGVAAAVELGPDVVLLACDLADDDGLSTARTIGSKVPGAKVLLLATRADDTLLFGALRAGCVGIVSKADAPATLIDALRAAAAGEPAVPAGKLLTMLSRLAQGEELLAGKSQVSGREREVLSLIARGLDVNAVAARLFLSGHTVRNHLRNAMAKLDAHTRLEAVMIASRRGLIDLG